MVGQRRRLPGPMAQGCQPPRFARRLLRALRRHPPRRRRCLASGDVYRGSGFVFRSSDDGKTWGEPAAIAADAVLNEPAIFHLGDGKSLVATRSNGLDLYASDDDAKTWSHRMKLTGEARHPGHITRLADGRLLVSYGNRAEPKGIDVRLSHDEGRTGSEPLRVADFQGDGGYPSSVQLPDGQVLTAFYAQRTPGHPRYHMGVVRWAPRAGKTSR